MIRAKRTSKEEAETLQKLLSIMKSFSIRSAENRPKFPVLSDSLSETSPQTPSPTHSIHSTQEKQSSRLQKGWLPQEGRVRRLLCPDPSCPICNAMTLEIQQLLGVEKKKTPSSSLRSSCSFSCLEALSPSKALVDQSSEFSSQHSRDISLPSRFTRSQSTNQKSTQSATPSTGDAVLQCYHSVPQQQQGPQGSNVPQDASDLSSSSMDEPGVPANQQKKRKKTKKLVLKNQAPSKAEMENKMTFFSHWINPEVKCDRQEEPTVVSKSETGAKPKTGEHRESHSSAKNQAKGANTEKPAKDLKAKPLQAKRNI